MLPSWIRSRNCRPRLVYFLAIDTTRRRLASTISALACSAWRSPSWISRTVSRRICSVMLRLLLHLLDLLLGVVDDLGQILDLVGAQAQLLDHRTLAQWRGTHLAQGLAKPALGHAGALLAISDLALGGLDARHEVLEPGDDAIDLLLVEAHVLHGIDHLPLDGCDLIPDLLARGLGRGPPLLDLLQLFVQPAYSSRSACTPARRASSRRTRHHLRQRP